MEFMDNKSINSLYQKAIEGDSQARNEIVMHYLDNAVRFVREIKPETEHGEVALILNYYIITYKPSFVSFRSNHLTYVRNKCTAKSKNIFDKGKRQSTKDLHKLPEEDTAQERLMEKVLAAVERLPLRTKNIIESRYGLRGEDKTQ